MQALRSLESMEETSRKTVSGLCSVCPLFCARVPFCTSFGRHFEDSFRLLPASTGHRAEQVRPVTAVVFDGAGHSFPSQVKELRNGRLAMLAFSGAFSVNPGDSADRRSQHRRGVTVLRCVGVSRGVSLRTYHFASPWAIPRGKTRKTQS